MQLIARLEHEERVWHVSWSPDGDLLASCSSDRTVRIWQSCADAWLEVSRLDDAHERTIRCCEWSPCSRMLSAVSFDATCTVWRRSTGEATLEWEILATLEGHENEVKSCAWNGSSTLLATCGRDKTLWLWEVVDDEAFDLVTVLHGHQGDVKAVTFDPEPQCTDLLASAAYDNDVKIWVEDGDDWVCRATLEGHQSTVWDCRFATPRGANRRLATCGADCSVFVWIQAAADAASWNIEARVHDAHTRSIYSIDVRCDLIVTAAGDNALNFFRLDESAHSHGPVALLKDAAYAQAHDSDVNCVRFHATDPALLATAADDACVKIWRRTPASVS